MSGQAQELADLRALLAIVDRAIGLQERAVAVIRACAAPGEPPTSVAREGGVVAGEYHRLWGWSLDFAPDAGTESLERRVSQLLMHHCQLLHVSIRLAFPKYRSERLERLRRSVLDLGPLAAELRSVRDELELWIATIE
ncbi:MAG TPA: hypothetical protein VGX25_05710 [Actinophytocola sp.]|uniref:hypothetical protein n=1 Tax=Actinophytocola sp. TaxID=1872138 RepID=UPI002DDD23AC|nr:hypothetical protein [Actinophytocola sp.]HEV2778880.1 hypothetical protein [Actinophytocola sp.]